MPSGHIREVELNLDFRYPDKLAGKTRSQGVPKIEKIWIDTSRHIQFLEEMTYWPCSAPGWEAIEMREQVGHVKIR